MPLPLRIISKNTRDTTQLARALAALLQQGDCITLTGDLGTGKTTFVRGVVSALGGGADVVSPSFMLAQSYDVTLSSGVRVPLWHYDMYRLKSAVEVRELGMEDALMQGVVLIEWPAIVAHALPRNHLAVRIEYGATADERIFVLAGDEAWYKRLGKLNSA